jgi:hypothetical protein
LRVENKLSEYGAERKAPAGDIICRAAAMVEVAVLESLYLREISWLKA